MATTVGRSERLRGDRGREGRREKWREGDRKEGEWGQNAGIGKFKGREVEPRTAGCSPSEEEGRMEGGVLTHLLTSASTSRSWAEGFAFS